MTQKLFGLGLGGTGIVGVLIVAGILLKATNLAPAQGDLAIGAGIILAIIMGLLGIFGIINRLSH
jgi:hypothetical protein